MESWLCGERTTRSLICVWSLFSSVWNIPRNLVSYHKSLLVPIFWCWCIRKLNWVETLPLRKKSKKEKKEFHYISGLWKKKDKLPGGNIGNYMEGQSTVRIEFRLPGKVVSLPTSRNRVCRYFSHCATSVIGYMQSNSYSQTLLKLSA